MNGNGTKYVTLLDDKNVHILDAGERTACGIPVPINGGAEWTYAEPAKVCAVCSRTEDKAEKLTEERAPFEEGVDMPYAAPVPEAKPEPTTKAKAKK
jgi:hypothetical protein